MASDPLDRNELPFVHEVDQKVMPTLAAVLSRGLGVTVAQLGFDYRYSVHGEQAILWHRPIPPQGEITGEGRVRSEEHTSELQSLMRISYAVFCLKKKIIHQ